MILKTQKFSINFFKGKKKKKLNALTSNIEENNSNLTNYKNLEAYIPILIMNKRNNCLSF